MGLDSTSIMFITIAIIVTTAFLIFMFFLIRSIMGANKPSDRMNPAKPYPEKVFNKEETAQFCKYCGAKFTEELLICSECGEQLK